MENRKKIAGILLMVILGLSLVAINVSAQDASSLEGIWACGIDRLVISGNSFTYSFYNEGKGNEIKGTFTVNGDNITFKADSRARGSYNTEYSFTDYGSLYFERGKGNFWWYGTFSKVDTEKRAYNAITANTRATPLEGSWFHTNPESKNGRITFSGNSFSYTMDGGEKKGLFTLDGNNISLHADDGTSWVTTYRFSHHDGNDWVTTNSPVYDSWIVLEQGQGCFWWWGAFARIHPDATVEGTWKHLYPLRFREVTFTFSGDTFTYTAGRVTRTGTFERTDTRLILTVNRRVVREYFYHFYENGSQLFLYDISGDSNTYIQGPLDKQ